MSRRRTRREGYECHKHQKENVDHQERAIDLVDLREDAVVVHPHDPDREEAHRVRHIGRPAVDQCLSQGDSGNIYVQDEQCGRNGEYAVTEGLESRRRHGGRLALLWPTASGWTERSIRADRDKCLCGRVMDASAGAPQCHTTGTTDKTAMALCGRRLKRSLRPTDGSRVGDRARPADRSQDILERTSARCLESDQRQVQSSLSARWGRCAARSVVGDDHLESIAQHEKLVRGRRVHPRPSLQSAFGQ